jgi:hypothetical protein
MKKCIDCKLEQTESNFSFDKSRNRYLSVCKKCTAIRTEAYRQKNKDKWRESSKKHADKSNLLIAEWKSKGCQKCGENRIHLIDAHHIDPSIKEFSVGSAMRGLKITEEELKKCIPLCSNCHRDFHHLEKKTRITIKDYLNLKQINK